MVRVLIAMRQWGMPGSDGWLPEVPATQHPTNVFGSTACSVHEPHVDSKTQGCRCPDEVETRNLALHHAIEVRIPFMLCDFTA